MGSNLFHFRPGAFLIKTDLSQTGKYVVRVEDLPRASKLPSAQRPMKGAEFEKYT